jgi:hypothetical protein
VLKGTERLERSSDRGAEVSRGRSSRWSNDHPRRAEKSAYRAKGRTSSRTSKEDRIPRIGVLLDKRNR